jgi:NTE family protein
VSHCVQRAFPVGDPPGAIRPPRAPNDIPPTGSQPLVLVGLSKSDRDEAATAEVQVRKLVAGQPAGPVVAAPGAEVATPDELRPPDQWRPLQPSAAVRHTSQTETSHGVALVLGGGGAAGNAWEIGVIAGLAEAGLDMTEAADLVVGTSAGATAAAQVRSGIPPAELLAPVLSPPPQTVGQNRDQPPSLPMSTVFERMRTISAAATSPADLQRAMGAFGLESDCVLGSGAGQRRATVAARLPHREWPERLMIVVAVNAHTGELAAFDHDSGVDLVDAVTASTALPGLAPTVNINGARYIDGGVRSPDNADLAAGYLNVVVLSPLGGRSQTTELGQFEGLRRPPEWGLDLASHVEALQKQGSHVEVITPDASSRAAIGTNQMNPASRIPSARAGFAQGKQQATRLTFV